MQNVDAAALDRRAEDVIDDRAFDGGAEIDHHLAEHGAQRGVDSVLWRTRGTDFSDRRMIRARKNMRN